MIVADSSSWAECDKTNLNLNGGRKRKCGKERIKESERRVLRKEMMKRFSRKPGQI